MTPATMQDTSRPTPVSGATSDAPPTAVKQYATLSGLQTQRPPKTKEGEVPGVGWVRVRALRHAEREEVTDPQMKRGFDDKGEFSIVLDNRGMKARAIALASIAADGSQFFPDPEKGAEIVGNLETESVEAWYQLVDDLNAFSAGAQKALGKGSSGTTKDAG